MTSPQLPPNAYTDAPQQHPNLILGSLQLLFWLVFRPSAWRNHLQRIDPILDTDFSLIMLLKQGRWRNFVLWRLLIQGCFILPILTNLPGLVLWALGEPIATILIWVALGMAFGMALGIGFGVALGTVFGAASTLAFNVAFGVTVAVALTVVRGVAFDIVRKMVFSVAAAVAVAVTFNMAVAVTLNVAFSVTGDMRVTINS